MDSWSLFNYLILKPQALLTVVAILVVLSMIFNGIQQKNKPSSLEQILTTISKNLTAPQNKALISPPIMFMGLESCLMMDP